MTIEQQLVDTVDRMPAFPKSVVRVLELTRNPDVSPKDIIEVIEKDPVLAAQILRVINSAFYAMPSKVSSVSQAVVMLGINTVKNLAIRTAAVGMIPAKNIADFDTDAYLLHSLGCAEICRLLAQEFDDCDPTEAYVAGLLHDFGKIMFTLHMPGPYRIALQQCAADNSELLLAERKHLRVDHTLAGAMLAEKWRFPDSLVDAIRNHHEPPPQVGLERSLFIANQLVKVLGFGHSGNGVIVPLPAGLGGALGDSYEAIASSLPDIEKHLQQVRSYAGTHGKA